GLSCTFRCLRHDGVAFYIKLQRDAPVARLATGNAVLADALEGTGLRIARVVAVNVDLRAVSYASATGQDLEQLLAPMSGAEAMRMVARVCTSLQSLWSAPNTPARLLDRQALLARSEISGRMICAAAPRLAGPCRTILNRLATTPARLPLRPIHGDFKLEHVLIGAGGITLIDTESLSLGPPDYDLAQFYGRLHMAAQAGTMPEASARTACQAVMQSAGNGFDWCLGVVAMRLAKFHAQRPGPLSAELAADILHRLRQIP
ncbi:MAG: phosphotransferase, partial [Albidovulum sp.]|uniref:phosphotransferase n=1 Tax=Albidovulum sp. TaxID=1872424 RepID=UPI003C9C8B83